KRRQIAELKRWITTQQFDCAVILLGDQFAALLAAAEIPIRVGVAGHALAPCLTHTYDIGSPPEWRPAARLNSLRTLGLSVAEAQPRVWVAEAEKTRARQILAEEGLAAGEAYAVIHPFGSTRAQWWPIERTAEVADWFRETAGWRTVLV